ncbi:hypothetical protein ES703_115628 [subsurface metagenome]
MSELPEHSRCPNCWDEADMTSFRPPPGFDPAMREYNCSHCGYEWYHIPKTMGEPKPVTLSLLEN